MARRFTLALSALVSVLLLTACSGSENGASDPSTRTTSSSSPESSQSESEDPTTSPSTSPVGTRTAAPPPSSPQSDPSPGTASWTASRKSGEAVGAAADPPVLQAVRVGRHETFHRVVFEFSEGTPEFFAEYTETLRQAGLGRKVEVAGEHSLLLVFHGITPESHFDAAPTTSVIREVRVVSIFEGEMRIGIGLDSGGAGHPGFRVDTFGDKVVVDFAHAS